MNPRRGILGWDRAVWVSGLLHDLGVLAWGIYKASDFTQMLVVVVVVVVVVVGTFPMVH